MIVELNNGNKYMVTWNHSNPQAAKVKMDGVIPEKRGSTKCIIWQLIPTEDLTFTKKVVATGEARCSKKDCYSREMGRKVSLHKALKEGRHFEDDKAHGTWEILPDNGLFREADRKVFWETYLNRKPKKYVVEMDEITYQFVQVFLQGLESDFTEYLESQKEAEESTS